MAGAQHAEHHQQRSHHRAGLVHDRMQAESETVAHFLGRLRQQHVASRPAQRFAGAFERYQNRRRAPVDRERQRRYRNHVHRVTKKSNDPVSVGAAGQASGKKSQALTEHFPQPGNECDLRGGRPQILQKRTDDAVRAFVGHVREQTDDSQADDEADGAAAFLVGRRQA